MFACDDDYDNDQEVAKHNFFSQPSPAVISQKKYPFALPASHLQGHGEEISSQFARMHVYFFMVLIALICKHVECPHTQNA